MKCWTFSSTRYVLLSKNITDALDGKAYFTPLETIIIS